MEEALHETSNDSESEWTQALRAEAVEGMLARAGLSQGGRAVVRSALGGASGGVEAQSPAQVRGLIAAQQQAEAALGDLDRINACVRLGGFINCTPDFATLPAIMNGASDLMVAVLGDKGRHARSTVGMAQLPLSAAVEVEAMFEVR